MQVTLAGVEGCVVFACVVPVCCRSEQAAVSGRVLGWFAASAGRCVMAVLCKS